MLLSPGQLWGLRFMALGAVLVVAAQIGGFVLFAGGDDDDSDDSGFNPETSGLTERVTKRDAGLSVFYPEGWKRTERQGIINLESPDRCVVVSMSAPVPAGLSTNIFRDSVAAVRRTYRRAEVRRQPNPPSVGDAPTETAVLAVQRKPNLAVVVRVSVSRAEQLAHVLQTVVRGPTCGKAVAESRAIVESIEYTR